MFADVRLLSALAMVAVVTAPAGAGGATPCADVQVRAAVQFAIETRLEQPVGVTLDNFACAMIAATPQALVATPDPSARTGRPVRFVIASASSGPRGHAVRLGEATAIVRVSGQYVRARRVLPQGGTLAAADLEVAAGPLDGLAFRPVPTFDQLPGARLMRGLAAGEPIVSDAVALPPAVRSGDEVRLTVREGGVEATVMAVAEQSASVGRIIRVVNASSHRALRARVTAPGEVEVVK